MAYNNRKHLKFWNLPYLVANVYGFNFIQIGGIWISRGGGGAETLIRGGLHLIYDAHFRTRMSYSSQKSCVKIGFGLVEIGGMLIFAGERSLLLRGGYMWPAMPIFELARAISVKSHVWKFGSDWLRLSRVMVVTYKKKKKKKNHRHSSKQYQPSLGRVTFDLRCPFSNLDELFQPHVMYENLVRTG